MIVLVIILFLIALYLYCIAPRLGKRPDYAPLFGGHYAHRGLHDNSTEAPENSMEAFRLAVEKGYGIEFDIQLTKDKIPVVFHDDLLKRVCNQPGYIWDYTYEELQKFPLCGSSARIPLLKDVLALVDGRVPLIIEFKMHDFNTEVCEIADPLLQTYKGRYCIESFHPAAVKWYRTHHPEIIRGQLSANFSTKEKREPFPQFCVHMLLTNVMTRPDFIAYCSDNTSNISRTLCRTLFHALSVSWTIRSEEELRKRYPNYDLFIFEHFIPEAAPKSKS